MIPTWAMIATKYLSHSRRFEIMSTAMTKPIPETAASISIQYGFATSRLAEKRITRFNIESPKYEADRRFQMLRNRPLRVRLRLHGSLLADVESSFTVEPIILRRSSSRTG